MRLAVIIGSTRNGRFGPTVAHWLAQQAAKQFEVDLVDLATANLPSTLPDTDDETPAEVAVLAPRLAAADAFAVVTPEIQQQLPGTAEDRTGLVLRGVARQAGRDRQLRPGDRWPVRHRAAAAGLHRAPGRHHPQHGRTALLLGAVHRRRRLATADRRLRGRGQDHARPARLVGPSTPGRAHQTSLPTIRKGKTHEEADRVHLRDPERRHRQPAGLESAVLGRRALRLLLALMETSRPRCSAGSPTKAFAEAWSQRGGDPFTDNFNAMPKYVASRTLTETTWNAQLLEGDAAEAVARLKEAGRRRPDQVRHRRVLEDAAGAQAGRRVPLLDLPGAGRR